MAQIKIPPILIPDITTTNGHSGGMALYVETWESVTYLYSYANVPRLADHTINHCTILN